MSATVELEPAITLAKLLLLLSKRKTRSTSQSGQHVLITWDDGSTAAYVLTDRYSYNTATASSTTSYTNATGFYQVIVGYDAVGVTLAGATFGVTNKKLGRLATAGQGAAGTIWAFSQKFLIAPGDSVGTSTALNTAFQLITCASLQDALELMKGT